MAQDHIQGLHHITMCTGTAQADVDFFVKVIGQRFVKRTLFYDGSEPIYHLYFADRIGTPGTVMTTFPTRRTGLTGRKGSAQFSVVRYSVPSGSLSWWRTHLATHSIESSPIDERFGEPYTAFKHPGCGIDFELVEDKSDTRTPWQSPYVPQSNAVRGFHSWVGVVRELTDMEFFLNAAWNFEKEGEDGAYHRYRVRGESGPAKSVDIRVEPQLPQGTWTLGEGTIHHAAFAVSSLEVQARIKFETEGMGFTDCSDRKNRGYFESVYVRTPGGLLFESTHSLSFTDDEPEETLGTDLKVSPQFNHMKKELLIKLNDPIVI